MRAERSTFGRAWARGAALAVLTLGLALAAASSAQAEWSQYRGSPERNARTVWDGMTGPTGTLDWQVKIGDGAMVDASPVVNPNTGIVYLGTTADSDLAGTARLLAFYPNGHGLTRVKVVLPEAVEMRELFKAAARHDVQIRKLNYRRDSLEDIFLSAMRDKGETSGRP